MEQNTDNQKNNEKEQQSGSTKKMKRRDVIKGLITVPVLGAFAYSFYDKLQNDKSRRELLYNELNLSPDIETPDEKITSEKPGRKLKIGIIGFGGRGESLIKALGFIHPKNLDDLKKAATGNKHDSRYKEFIEQEDLNIEITGICDVYDIHAERAMIASANIGRVGTNGKFGEKAKRYKTYKELLAADNIDAVIIATPDHWHARMVIDAANAGKHVYVEKPLTRTVPEVYKVVEAVKKNNIVFQLGHQGRQTDSYLKAQEIIKKKLLGHVSLIEVATNRNSPNGAWVYPIDEEASPQNIDWEQFLGNAPKRPFNLERFFRWRCWWDYGTGLSGDLLTHEYDAINQIMNLGIPHKATASGGIYHFNDGRDVPDVFQAVFEYPNHDLSLLYTATLASRYYRGKKLMGSDATMELGRQILLYPDENSKRYEEKLKAGILKPDVPMYTYVPGKSNTDAITSATERYFANRGLLYTYRGGKRVDTTHLHLKEWLTAIRGKGKTSCGIEQAFQEAITAHMATLAYRKGRTMIWDESKQVIEGYEDAKDMDLEDPQTEPFKEKENVEDEIEKNAIGR